MEEEGDGWEETALALKRPLLRALHRTMLGWTLTLTLTFRRRSRLSRYVLRLCLSLLFVSRCRPLFIPSHTLRPSSQELRDGMTDFVVGAVNGMKPSGAVDQSCLQSQEVWTGTTCESL